MATLREIKQRISSVRSTGQITRAMKMVAAAKLRKAQNRLIAARPYAHELNNVLGHVAATHGEKHPFFFERSGNRVCYVIVTSDRGLCGSFNANVLRRAKTEREQSSNGKNFLVTVGKKGYDQIKRQELPVLSHYIDVFDHLEFKNAQNIAATLIRGFLSKKFDKVQVIYQEFKSPVQQKIMVEQLLPIVPVLPETEYTFSDFVYDPKSKAILKRLAPMHLNFQMWRILLESSASEHGARMTAMETATDNAEEMIRTLVLYYNQARQAAITKELNEIVSGAEALRG
ncbi:MAG: ATP synthase F1 subunit gamma [Calditrichaeota bacterium]|nr:ATP synthase F1 subunit gamma [Calditrichota bacterium]